MLTLLLTLVVQVAGAEAGTNRITLDEFRALYEKGEVFVVDVRGEDAYRGGHIPGAVWIPADAIEERIDELKSEKRPIVTYCS